MSSTLQSPAAAPILPGATLGVLGGGQLGRMFAQAAQSMGYATVVLDPDAHSPAGLISQQHIRTGYEDPLGLAALAQSCAAVTTEFENVPAAALEQLAKKLPVAPMASAVALAQDRIAEKAHFKRCGVPVAPYAVIESAEQLAAVPEALFPGILKTARLGYDGKGQQRIASAADLAGAWERLGRVPCVLEKMLPLAQECSIILARGRDGDVVHFPAQRNLHRDGILAVTEVYRANLSPLYQEQALDAARAIANKLNYVGVLCVEFFILEDGSLVVNEMAPRPHNSGHYSLNACDVSQFELQVRCMTGLPLAQPRLHSSCVMLNLLGDLWFPPGTPAGAPVTPPWDKVLALQGSHLHLYGKQEAKPGRKMGHLNITGISWEPVYNSARSAASILGIADF